MRRGQLGNTPQAGRTCEEDVPKLGGYPRVVEGEEFDEDLICGNREDTTLAVAVDYTLHSKEDLIALGVNVASVLNSGDVEWRADGGLDQFLRTQHSEECDETIRCPLAYSWVCRTAGCSSLDTIHVRRFRSAMKESRIGEETVLVPL